MCQQYCWQVLAPYFSTDFEISGTLLSSSAGTHKINMGTIKEYHLKVPAPKASSPKKTSNIQFYSKVLAFAGSASTLIFQHFLKIQE